MMSDGDADGTSFARNKSTFIPAGDIASSHVAPQSSGKGDHARSKMEEDMKFDKSLEAGVRAAVIGSMFLVLGCTSSNQSTTTQPRPFYMKDAYERTQAHLDQCTRQHGYDPQAARNLGQYQLPANEKAWRTCAYEGIRTNILPATKYPELYTALIEKDKAMTDQVGARKMTRAERRRQLEENFARIREQERAEMAKARPTSGSAADVAQHDQLMQSTMNVVNNVSTRMYGGR